MATISDMYDVIKYCALTNVGSYSAFELHAQANQYVFCSPEAVEQVLKNLIQAGMIYQADSIPAPVYGTLQPQLWEQEARDFFLKLKTGKSTKIVTHSVDADLPTPSGNNKKSTTLIKKGEKVKPINSTLTVTTTTTKEIENAESVSPPVPPAPPEPIQSVKVTPPVNNLKRRWYEAHPEIKEE